MINQNQINISLASVKQWQLRAEMYRVRIETGVYKTRIVHKGGLDGPLMTEEELLKDEIATMNQHIRLAQNQLEYTMNLVGEEPTMNKFSDGLAIVPA
jgi:hypothetical protein